jgi:hypothetical protein
MNKYIKTSLFIIFLLLLISCTQKKQETKINKNVIEDENQTNTISFTIVDKVLQVICEYENGRQEVLFSKNNVIDQYSHNNICYFIKNENNCLKIYYLEYFDNKIIEQYLSDTSGYYCYSFDNNILVNIRDLRNPFGVTIYDIVSKKEVKWLDMTQFIKNELYGDKIGNIKIDINHNKAIIAYYDLWDELFENITVNLRSYEVERQLINYSKQIPQEIKNDLIVKPKINIMDSYLRIRELGYHITYGKEKDKQLQLYKKDEQLISFDNVRLYLYDSTLKRVILLKNLDENGLYTLQILHLDTLNIVNMGYAYDSMILSSDGLYLGIKTIKDDNPIIAIIKLEDEKMVKVFNYETLFSQKSDSCDFVKFDYPVLGILYTYNNSNDKYLELNVLTEECKNRDVNHYKDFNLDVPSIH